jgi:hypothetical protein
LAAIRSSKKNQPARKRAVLGASFKAGGKAVEILLVYPHFQYRFCTSTLIGAKQLI